MTAGCHRAKPVGRLKAGVRAPQVYVDALLDSRMAVVRGKAPTEKSQQTSSDSLGTSMNEQLEADVQMPTVPSNACGCASGTAGRKEAQSCPN